MRRTLLAVMVLAASLAAAARQEPTDPFKRSDPKLLSTTGRPQLVDFYHPE